MAMMKTIINNRKANLTAEGITLRPGQNVMTEEKARKFIANKGEYCACACVRLGIGATLLSMGLEAFSYAMADSTGSTFGTNRNLFSVFRYGQFDLIFMLLIIDQ